MRRGALVLACLLALAPSRARAQTGQPQPLPIGTNRYNVELFQGPVLAPLRVVGLGGAYAPYAESSDGIPANAAAPAVREPYSISHVDYDLAFSVSFPGAFRNTDFNNDGKSGFTYNDFVFYTLGAVVQVGRLGIGLLGDFQRFNLSPKTMSSDVKSSLTIGRMHLLGAWSFFNNQMVLGGGARGTWLDIESSSSTKGSGTALWMVGAAPELGVLIKPDYVPWRIGATFRSPVSSRALHDKNVQKDPNGVERAVGLAIPENVYMPWEVEAGFAIQLGPRPLNPRWIDPGRQEEQAREALKVARASRRATQNAELARISDPTLRARRVAEFARDEEYLTREEEVRQSQLERQMKEERRARYWNWPRQHILIIAEALITGPSPNAVGLESFLSQTAQRSGAHTTVTPRLGIEGEPVVGYIKTRIGTYLEPGRYSGSYMRQHFTFGFDIRLFVFKGWWFFAPSTFRLTGVADLAPRYENIGLSIGGWH